MTKQYFGTDGIRGTYGKSPITEAFMEPLSNALAHYLQNMNTTPSVVIGQDPRESGLALTNTLANHLSKQGITVYRLGIVPTAAVPIYLLQKKVTLGIAITASHNPATDNGLKFFNYHGHKLSSEEEDTLEALINKHPGPIQTEAANIHSINGTDAYLKFMEQHFGMLNLKNWSIALDTANGATCDTTPAYLKALGAQVTCIGNLPDGKNINEQVGSEHPENLQKLVKDSNATIGIAHDGDGDRVIFCDEKGNIVDGDEILGLLALQLNEDNQLKNHIIVTTIQSNTGLEQSLKASGINMERAQVGDRNVLYKMINLNCSLGGENSGHIIFKNILPAGDGLIAALSVIKIMKETGKTLSELRQSIQLFPQLTDTLVVKEKKPLNILKHLPQAIEALEEKLGSDGRVLIRYSGTEPKLRFLVEGPDTASLEKELSALKQVAEKELS